MFFDFDEGTDFALAGEDADEAIQAPASKGPAARTPPRTAGAPWVGLETLAGHAAEDLELVEKISAGAVRRFGEAPSQELRRQLLANLRAQRVEPLGGDWAAVERHPPWRRVELRPRPGAPAAAARTPEPGERIVVRLRACAPEPGAPGAFRPLAASQEALDCILGDGSLPEGVEKALPRIGVGHAAEVRCVGEACLRDWPAEGLEQLPPDGWLVWEVQLVKIVSVRGLDDPKCYTNHFVADAKQRMARANELRERGNALLKAGRIVKAVEVYEAGECFTSLFEPEDSQGPGALGGQAGPPPLFGDPREVNKRIREAKKPLMLNRALAVQKQGNWRTSADICTEVLRDLDPDCVKAIFRRGKSRVRLKEFQGATEDLLRAKLLDKSVEPQVRKELALLKRLEKQADINVLGARPSENLQAAISKEPSPKGDRCSEKEREACARTRADDSSAGEQVGNGGGCGGGSLDGAGGSSSSNSKPQRSAADQPTLHGQSGGKTAPEGSRTRMNPKGEPGAVTVPGRVSIICPTMESRHDRLPQLYVCFLLQDVEDKELIVVDTGQEPSHFLNCLQDSRVKYRHIPGSEDSMTIGAKRNYAIVLASGEFVAHFDDDDLYAPPYLGGMLRALHSGGASVCKLVAWHILDTEACVCGHYDNSIRLPQPFEGDRDQGLLAGGYGFSFVYRRQVALKLGFRDVSWGEDTYFANTVKAASVHTVFIRDTDFVCLHTQHGQNLSRSIAQTLVAPRTCLAFLGQLGRLAGALVSGLLAGGPRAELPAELRGVRLRGRWDPSQILAPDVRAAFVRATAALTSPGRAPLPVGLLVCSLYDEYYTGLQEGQPQAGTGPKELDPLQRWRDNPRLGMTAWPSARTGFISSPLKPMEGDSDDCAWR